MDGIVIAAAWKVPQWLFGSGAHANVQLAVVILKTWRALEPVSIDRRDTIYMMLLQLPTR